jgi:hypothetical protein
MSKYCSKCKLEKSEAEFNIRRDIRKGCGLRSWCKSCEAKRKITYRYSWKSEAINYYGKKCQCCDVSEIEFLTIDHIEGKGQLHRRNIKRKGGDEFYRWMAKNGYPKGYQVLCFNCNSAKGFYGVCPHKKVMNVQTNERPNQRKIRNSALQN